MSGQASAAQAGFSVRGSEDAGATGVPDLYSSDSIRLTRELVRDAAASCPEALAVLCRVCWYARSSGLCFAKQATLRAAGLSMTLPVLRRGLRWLVARGILSDEASLAQGTVVYRPLLPKKPTDSVFIPLEVWRWRKPTEVALYALWAAGGQGLSAPELGQRIAGRAGKPLSRSRSYAVLRTLQDTGLIPSDPSPQSSQAGFLKSVKPASAKRSTNTDSFNSGLLNSEEGKGAPLLLMPDSIDSGQLEFPFMRAQLRIEEPEMFIDWLAVTGLSSVDLSGESHVANSAPPAAGRAVGTHRTEAAPVRAHRAAPPRPSTRRDERGAGNCGQREDRPVSGGRPAGTSAQPLPTAVGVPQDVPTGGESAVAAAWAAVRDAAGVKFGLYKPDPVAWLGIEWEWSSRFRDAALLALRAGYTTADFGLLGEYIAAGKCDWEAQVRKIVPYRYICQELRRCLEAAQHWNASGREQTGQRSGLPQPARATNDDSHLLRATPERRVRGLRDDE